jgi:hypothetical protein
VGFLLGRASNPKTWGSARCQKVEKDALFAQPIDSDFAGGFSDNDSFVNVPATLRSKVGAQCDLPRQPAQRQRRANGAGQTEVDPALTAGLQP